MPTINLPNNSTPPVQAPVVNNNQPMNPAPQRPADPWATPIGGTNDWGWGGNNNTNAAQPTEKKLSPNERVEMIEKLYEEVLSRKADTRDINYYKYSTLGESEIRSQLISGKEHKQLIIDGKEYKKMKDRAVSAEARVRMLENQIKDQVSEFQQLTNLLSEKNRHIKTLREQTTGTYNFQTRPVQSQPHIAQQNKELSNDINGSVFYTPEATDKKKDRDEKVGFMDLIKSLIP